MTEEVKEAIEVEAFDLSALDTIEAANKGAEIELKHPVTKEGVGIFVTILGKDSETFRSYVKEETNARIRKNAMATRRGKEIDIPTAEEAEERATDLLIICILGWRQELRKKSEDGKTVEVVKNKPTITFKGQELAHNVQNARLLLTGLPWFRLQIDEAIGDIENFIQG